MREQGDDGKCILRNTIIFILSKMYKIVNFSLALHWRLNGGGGVLSCLKVWFRGGGLILNKMNN